ncbi:ATP synthase-coupling factor 6, mitochondrial isoform X2 [Centruroides vittatus]
MLQNHLGLIPRAVYATFRRNVGISAVLLQKTPTDPIQKLFVDKLREYTQKSKTAKGGLVDASPQTLKDYEAELTKVKSQYSGGKDVDMTKFPAFNFVDPKIDPINLEKKQ